jgi:hypothetical protein
MPKMSPNGRGLESPAGQIIIFPVKYTRNVADVVESKKISWLSRQKSAVELQKIGIVSRRRKSIDLGLWAKIIKSC